MRLLLDTHVLLWALVEDERLSKTARELIVDPDNSIHVSAACFWEIAIKHALGRGNMPIGPAPALAWCREAGYRTLSVSAAHAIAVHDLPALHADPFDRVLVAQALREPMRLITHDALVASYDPSIIRI